MIYIIIITGNQLLKLIKESCHQTDKFYAAYFLFVWSASNLQDNADFFLEHDVNTKIAAFRSQISSFTF